MLWGAHRGQVLRPLSQDTEEGMKWYWAVFAVGSLILVAVLWSLWSEAAELNDGPDEPYIP